MSNLINKDAVLAAIPRNWLDDLLTGKSAPELPWNCPEVERLLNEVRARIQALPPEPSNAQLEADNARYKAALKKIADQMTLSELSENGEDCEGDFEGTYDALIEKARAALSRATDGEG